MLTFLAETARKTLIYCGLLPAQMQQIWSARSADCPVDAVTSDSMEESDSTSTTPLYTEKLDTVNTDDSSSSPIAPPLVIGACR